MLFRNKVLLQQIRERMVLPFSLQLEECFSILVAYFKPAFIQPFAVPFSMFF